MNKAMRFAATVLAATLAVSPAWAQTTDSDAPKYKADASWPKPLPNNWLIGEVGGLAVDSHDQIWVLQRPRSLTKDEAGLKQNPPISQCCTDAPSILVFDTEGNLIKSWGGPGFIPNWPQSEHGLWVDKSDNVWMGGNGVEDRQLLKFDKDGKLLMTIGKLSKEAKSNQNTDILGRPAGIDVDDKAKEVYIADGYLNNRIVVYDANTGKFKRGWGGYGIPLSKITNPGTEADGGAIPMPPPYSPANPPSKQFGKFVHCVRLSADGFVYVCDRENDRIQVFTKAGKFVKEFTVRPETLFTGSTWTINFSSDPKQKYLLVADGANNTIWIVNRQDGKTVSSFGRSGRNAGDFHWVHQGGTDSKGNYYTGEVETGKRIQKFTLQP
jgi:DNA-binding beta-propeller fold protein YncE